jgi:hypothetical protein
MRGSSTRTLSMVNKARRVRDGIFNGTSCRRASQWKDEATLAGTRVSSALTPSRSVDSAVIKAVADSDNRCEASFFNASCR